MNDIIIKNINLGKKYSKNINNILKEMENKKDLESNIINLENLNFDEEIDKKALEVAILALRKDVNHFKEEVLKLYYKNKSNRLINSNEDFESFKKRWLSEGNILLIKSLAIIIGYLLEMNIKSEELIFKMFSEPTKKR
ncbi:hypothetical protein KY334_01600 [Candidatus Woesearchaeota archaeon]|nr:hypothetical protein [Candidatus Woesearchaeota archaeon]